MEKLVILMIFLIMTISLAAQQEVTLKECIESAVQNSPINAQKKIYLNSSGLESKNISAELLPKLNIDAQGSYQSDVFKLPISLPGVSMKEIPKEQYKATFGVNQLIYDGGINSALNEKSKFDYLSYYENVETALFKLKENVISLFFNIKLLDKNLDILFNHIGKMTNDRNKYSIMKESGVVTDALINKIDIEIEKLKLKINSTISDRQSVLTSLTFLTGRNYINSKFAEVKIKEDAALSELNRPEIKSIEFKQKSLAMANEVNKSVLMPKVAAFAQAGGGSPNPFNMFETDFSMFWIAGLKMQWDIWDWSKSSRKSEIIESQINILQTESDNFKRNLLIESAAYSQDIIKYENSIKSSMKMIELQKKVLDEKKIQMENGTATVTDYFIEQSTFIDLETNLELQKINLEYSKVKLLNISGNF